jgi:hypothetical protein
MLKKIILLFCSSAILLCVFGQAVFGADAFSSNSAVQTKNTTTKENIKRLLLSDYYERLYSKTYFGLLDRMRPDGYLQESMTGAYQGMFPRTSGPFVLLMIETGRYNEAQANIDYVLKTLAKNDMERVPRVIGSTENVLDDQFQIDGQAHLILAWARLALARGNTKFEDETWPQVKALMSRTCDRTFFQYGGWSIEPGLVRNIAFEHSKDHRMWDVWDLLTQSFVGASLQDMAEIARRRGDSELAKTWSNKRSILSRGIATHLVTNHYGPEAYVEMFVPNGDGGIPYYGLGWVTVSPVAAGWEGVDHQVLRNTVNIMQEKLLKQTAGVTWMPTDGYPDGRFSNEIIGKGMAWEIDFARSEHDYARIAQLLSLIKTVNAENPIYMEGGWLEGNGYHLSDIISEPDLAKMQTSVWKIKDAGNGEQSAWWCWSMSRLRKDVGLPAEPARMAN